MILKQLYLIFLVAHPTAVTMQDATYRFRPTSANGFNTVGPNSTTLSSNHSYEGEACFTFSKLLKKWGTRVTMSLVLVVGFGFNVPRWLEWETISYYETESPLPENQSLTFHGPINQTIQDRNNQYDTSLSAFHQPQNIHDNSSSFDNQFKKTEDGGVLKTTARRSAMIDNESYYFFYHLLGSCIVMILIPAVILLWAYCSFRKMTPTGANKRRTHRIMLIIITMFFVCHCPKVITKELI